MIVRLRQSTAGEKLMRNLFDRQDQLGLTNRDLSNLTGIATHTLSRLRHPHGNGGKHPTIDQARRISEALGLTFYITAFEPPKKQGRKKREQV